MSHERRASPAADGSDTMTASDEEHHYSVPIANPLVRRTTSTDTDEEPFLSDPSLSEASSSAGRRRHQPPRYTRKSSLSEEERPNHTHGFARYASPHHSPGNTSLSSWDSPAMNQRKVVLHYTPPGHRQMRNQPLSDQLIPPNLQTGTTTRRGGPPETPLLLPRTDDESFLQGAVHVADESVVMTFSDSEAEESELLPAATTEKSTATRPRANSTEKRHRRTRSGDTAAASLATGRSDWKGMLLDQIPMPEGEDDDDEEEPRRYTAGPFYQQSFPFGRRDSLDYSYQSSEGRPNSQDSRTNGLSRRRSSVSQPSGEEDSGEEQLRSVHSNQLRLDQGSSLEDMEAQFEDRNFRGTFQNVVRHHSSPVVEQFSRAAFNPFTSLHHENPEKYPTYICPRCQTRQRAFFTVSDAPRQMQGPSGYLALYFFIYVVASLFIFGLEEGWLPLDCIYFAVITLTTAGLGDFTPTTNANKVVCSVFIYFGVACIGLLLGSYIASMLDDKAFRDAKERQVTSCPNCAKMRSAVVASQPETPFSAGQAPDRRALMQQARQYTSERMVDAKVQNRQAVFQPHRHRHQQIEITRSSEHSTVGIETPSPQNERMWSPPDGAPGHAMASHVRRSSSGSNSTSRMPLGTIGETDETDEKYSPLTSESLRNTALVGTPAAARTAGRQTHTRHYSIDVGSDAFQSMSIASRARKMSEDYPASNAATPTATLSEGTPLVSGSGPRSGGTFTSERQSFARSGSNFADYGDDDSTASGSSFSSTDELLDETTMRIKTAKYVFLTLKEALVNSLVIISVGCMGFWLVEGFTLIDSWYFTTVLLTTVGYGDIVPVTKGGKLFATVYILVAGTMLLNNMSMISMIPLELRKRRIERAVLTQFGDELDDAALRELATGPLVQKLRLTANRADGLDECTREMFSLAMLVRLGKVTESDILDSFAAFRRLDVNDEGVLNSKSIIAAMWQKRRRNQQENVDTSMEAVDEENCEDDDIPPPPPLSAVPSNEGLPTQFYGRTDTSPPNYGGFDQASMSSPFYSTRNFQSYGYSPQPPVMPFHHEQHEMQWQPQPRRSPYQSLASRKGSHESPF